MELKDWMKRCYDVAQEKGWHDKPLEIQNELMNFHAEISEAWEELRKGKGLTEVYVNDLDGYGGTNQIVIDMYSLGWINNGHKPEGFPIELADLAIRLFHTCAYHGIDLEKYMELKEAYNKTRPYRHGNKTA